MGCGRCHRCGGSIIEQKIHGRYWERCQACKRLQRPRSHGHTDPADDTVCVGPLETRSRGVRFVNVTPHPITLVWPDGEVCEVPASGVVVRGDGRERVVEPQRLTYGGLAPALVHVSFTPTDAGQVGLERIEREYSGATVVGSLLAARAYPRRVVAMIQLGGDRARADKFQVF